MPRRECCSLYSGSLSHLVVWRRESLAFLEAWDCGRCACAPGGPSARRAAAGSLCAPQRRRLRLWRGRRRGQAAPRRSARWPRRDSSRPRSSPGTPTTRRGSARRSRGWGTGNHPVRHGSTSSHSAAGIRGAASPAGTPAARLAPPAAPARGAAAAAALIAPPPPAALLAPPASAALIALPTLPLGILALRRHGGSATAGPALLLAAPAPSSRGCHSGVSVGRRVT